MPDIWNWIFIYLLEFGVGMETSGPSQGRIALGLCRKTIGGRGVKGDIFLGSGCEGRGCEGAHTIYDTKDIGRFTLVTLRRFEGIDDLIDSPRL